MNQLIFTVIGIMIFLGIVIFLEVPLPVIIGGGLITLAFLLFIDIFLI